MRFRLEHPERAPYWLIGDPALNERTEATQGLQTDVQISRNQQELAGAGFPSRLFLDRENQKVAFGVESRREFASEWERMDFLARLAPVDDGPEEHAWEGDVWVRIDEGNVYREWLLPDAVISLAGTKPEGEVGLRLSYRIQAGGISSGRTSAVKLLLIRTNVSAAEVSVSAAELNAAASAAGWGSAWDFLQMVLIYPDGATYVSAYNLEPYYAAVTLPFNDADLDTLAAYFQAWMSADHVFTAESGGTKRLHLKTAGAVGNGCYAAINLSREFPLWTKEDQGSDDRLPINFLPSNKILTINLIS